MVADILVSLQVAYGGRVLNVSLASDLGGMHEIQLGPAIIGPSEMGGTTHGCLKFMVPPSNNLETAPRGRLISRFFDRGD